MIERFYTSGHKILRWSDGEEEGDDCPFGGEGEGEWGTQLTVSGKLWPLSGDERLSADKETYFSDHKFATGIAPILETDRYQDPDGNEYYIKAILPRKRADGTGHLELSLERIQ